MIGEYELESIRQLYQMAQRDGVFKRWATIAVATTGFNFPEDEVVAITIVRAGQGGKIKNWLVKPRGTEAQARAKITKISKTMASKGKQWPYPAELLESRGKPAGQVFVEVLREFNDVGDLRDSHYTLVSNSNRTFLKPALSSLSKQLGDELNRIPTVDLCELGRAIIASRPTDTSVNFLRYLDHLETDGKRISCGLFNLLVALGKAQLGHDALTSSSARDIAYARYVAVREFLKHGKPPSPRN